MHELTLNQLHEIVGGRLRLATLGPREGEWTRLGHIGTDSRQLQPGEVFWALKGRNHDGASFIESAFARGAAGVIAARYVQPWPGCWALEVEDGREALYRLARYHRDQFRGKLVAVGGVTSTATTRRMVATVLGSQLSGTNCPQRGNRLESVALGMLGLEPQHQYAVFDLNFAAPGDVSSLCAECGPAVCGVTDVSSLRANDSRGTLLHDAAAQLIASVPPEGHAVLNGDDPAIRRAATQCRAKALWVGESSECNLIASRVLSTQGRLCFVVDGQTFHVSAWGRHQLSSALCAIGVGRVFGMSMPEIARALEGFDPPPKQGAFDEDHSIKKPSLLTSTVTPSFDGTNHILRFDAGHRPRRRAA